MQFQLRGPRGVATVLASAARDAAEPGGWAFSSIAVSDAAGQRPPIIVKAPGQDAQLAAWGGARGG